MVTLIPSVYAHVANGILLLIAVIILSKNYSKIALLEPYKLLIITLLFSLSVGVHGLSHLGLEQYYGYTPLHHCKYGYKK
jgi:hypothetical protein